ncbi:hypothetical protein PPL_05512 [Heterostelium album PN500]|uniref:COI1 F-box domain-containing protein n=1 Tax=Heterostelium pallidum (strain ATCC 26659 / Pp 5 / PN500) TaxID=670386 RepID=D3BAD6_HETP5|nr:hypothetical protein PPL_05512 [Heterostelium album PN500]EFA81523.1 hypothetical protein PPL_05512 [Heterostelium album PN500]|eukprot:XP_020433640.1 hypothetical protein PPL_05512 [Heterostelium album PN500]
MKNSRLMVCSKMESENQTNKLVNLSHFLLRKIICFVDEDIDRIVFSLVCKRWFNDRHSYLIFNKISIAGIDNIEIKRNHEHFKLPSYDNIFLKTIQTKSNCSLLIADPMTDLLNFRHYDFIVKNDHFKYLYRLLSESQSVTSFLGCSSLEQKLPNSIKTLELTNNFKGTLTKESMPDCLELLFFRNGFTQRIEPGVLPEGLTEITFSGEYECEFTPGVFPSTLRVLNIESYRLPLQPGVLPNKLEKLEYSGARTHLGAGVLPSSLKIIVNVSPSWIPELTTLSNLEELFLRDDPLYRELLTLNMSHLPSSLKLLHFDRPHPLVGTMPNSIQILNFNKCPFKYDELFPSSLQYHLTTLKYYNNMGIDQIPPNVRVDRLEHFRNNITNIYYRGIGTFNKDFTIRKLNDQSYLVYGSSNGYLYVKMFNQKDLSNLISIITKHDK